MAIPTFGDMIHLFKGSGSLTPSAAVAMFVQGLGGWQLACVALLSAVVLLLGFGRKITSAFDAAGLPRGIFTLIATQDGRPPPRSPFAGDGYAVAGERAAKNGARSCV